MERIDEEKREKEFLRIQKQFYEGIDKSVKDLNKLGDIYEDSLAIYSFLFLLFWTTVESESKFFKNKKISKSFLKDAKNMAKRIINGDKPKSMNCRSSDTVLH
jgi:hypothetical protein